MKREQIQDFTRRVTTGNRTALTVVVFEILFAYIADAKEAYDVADDEGFKVAIRKADSCTKHLMDVLDFKYEISKNLYASYLFCRKHLSIAMMKHSTVELDEVKEILKPLYEAFLQISESDTSEPVMKNAETVYAGMTYGRASLNENSQITSGGRGFFA